MIRCDIPWFVITSRELIPNNPDAAKTKELVSSWCIRKKRTLWWGLKTGWWGPWGLWGCLPTGTISWARLSSLSWRIPVLLLIYMPHFLQFFLLCWFINVWNWNNHVAFRLFSLSPWNWQISLLTSPHSPKNWCCPQCWGLDLGSLTPWLWILNSEHDVSVSIYLVVSLKTDRDVVAWGIQAPNFSQLFP